LRDSHEMTHMGFQKNSQGSTRLEQGVRAH
jgi:hypothetical protein